MNATGSSKRRNLLAYEGSGDGPPERLVRIAKRVAERAGITLRSLNMKRSPRRSELVKALYNKAWEKTGALCAHRGGNRSPGETAEAVTEHGRHGPRAS